VSGFKSRGLKMTNGAEPLAPGEFRDVESLDGKIQDHLMFLPSRQTDPTSLSLLQLLTAEAKNLASAPDVKTSDASAAATGAMMAVLERALSVMSAVQSRAADALGTELTILKRIIAEDMPEAYDYETEGGTFSRAEDFKAAVGIRCVADPSASTQAMRILRNQAITAQASQNPDLYDQSELHRRVLRDLGVEDIEALIPRAGEAPQRDPVSENQALMIGQAVKAFMGQDHQAHIAVHMAAMQDPSIQAFVGQSQNGPKIQAAAHAHIMDHLALQYREVMEEQLGFALPPPGEPLPADIENQIARMAAQAKVQNLGPAPQAQEQAPDPIVMMQQQELQLKQMQLQLDQQKLQMQSEMAAAKLQHQADIAQMNARMALRQDETKREAAVLAAEVEMARIAEEGADKRADRAIKVGIASEQIAQKDRIEGVKAGLRAAEVQRTAEDLRNVETPAPEGTDE